MADEYIIEFKDVTKHYGDHLILDNINLQIRNGEFLTLLGPSGCGKTTLLHLISGLSAPSTGKIIIANQDVSRTPPQQRQVHTVFQNYALFPHMTVFENVAFGLRCSGVSRQQIEPRVMEALEMVQLPHLRHRKPDELSGGQQQRVAIARAVVNKPFVLLLDEPLSSLDYRLRKAMQIEMKQLQRKLAMTFIFVTHDQEEALSMADRVVVMQEGRIQQVGTPRQVYEEPKNLSVARFIGEINIFATTVQSIHHDKMIVMIEDKPITILNKRQYQVNDSVYVTVRPEDLRVWGQTEVKATENMLPGIVEEAIYKGSTVDLMVRLSSGKIIAATQFFDEDDDSLSYSLGEKVWVQWLAGWEVTLPNEK